MTYQRRAGLTLMELLIVLAILVALLAILLPGVFVVQSRWYVRQADMQIKYLQGQLEQYAVDNKGYPTNEQGLYVLAFIPDNAGVLPTVPQPGMPGATDPGLGGMGGGSVGIGPEALGNPVASPTGTAPGAVPGTMPDPTNMAGMGMPAAGGAGMMPDPTGMGMGGVGAAGMMTSAWTQFTYNPQIYLQQRRRSESTSYIPNLEGLTDPWGVAYRYDNSQLHYGLNQTGSSKPAIWSAGPDKTDGTDDDVRSWDPLEAQQAITRRQQQMQGGMATGTTGTIDPMTGMQTQPGGVQMSPMQGSGMPTQPGGMQMPPMQGSGMPTQPGGMQMPPMQGSGMPVQSGGMQLPTPTSGIPTQPGGSGMPTSAPTGGLPMPVPTGAPPMQ